MSFYKHTLTWITGELFEAYFISSFGVIKLSELKLRQEKKRT